MKVGILGGTFNPVHLGHLALAEGAQQALGLDQVWWIPARVPPLKASRDLASAEDRVRMVELAIAGRPAFQLSRIELDRDGPSYTVDTLRAVTQAQPETAWHVLLGSDTVPDLPKWRAIDEAMRLATFVVVPRPGVPWPMLPPQVQQIDVPAPDISASEIRRRVKAGQPIAGLVPDAVAQYVAQHHLYS